MTDMPVLCPIKPHEIPTPLRRGLGHIAEKVAAQAAIHGLGRDLFLLIYTAGIFHGVELMKQHEGEAK